eukprot:Gb_40305 [translate_table: standard]
MGRGNSSGGGQSSLGYLFGSDEPAKPVQTSAQPVHNPVPVIEEAPAKPTTVGSKLQDNENKAPVGMLGRNFNNYLRADGQNTGNFITDRPSTKVHAAPGGGSSLGYLFGGPSN